MIRTPTNRSVGSLACLANTSKLVMDTQRKGLPKEVEPPNRGWKVTQRKGLPLKVEPPRCELNLIMILDLRTSLTFIYDESMILLSHEQDMFMTFASNKYMCKYL